ncbi:MAG TPA: hypothetical protein DCY07_05030 [Rhodospirillaceae bacterium]|nr:hypothetical protein [Rhodospirillaceae bacterium]
MRRLSLIDILSFAFSALIGVAVLWGVLALFAFSLVIVLPVLLVLGLSWAGYVWWKMRNFSADTNIINGESREIVEPAEDGTYTVTKHVEMTFEKKAPTHENPVKED